MLVLLLVLLLILLMMLLVPLLVLLLVLYIDTGTATGTYNVCTLSATAVDALFCIFCLLWPISWFELVLKRQPPSVFLQNLNFTGFRKILKKHDKILETSRGADWRVVHVEVAPFYTCKKITQIISETEVRRTNSQLSNTQSSQLGCAAKKSSLHPQRQRTTQCVCLSPAVAL